MTSLERAFVLARSGDFTTLKQIARRLDYEGLDGDQLEGAALRRQLQCLIELAVANKTGEAGLRQASSLEGREADNDRKQ